ncbi:MAG: response regulator [Chloroflexales bacterium]|nr:response regulator [Chloroflexales bacterium]
MQPNLLLRRPARAEIGMIAESSTGPEEGMTILLAEDDPAVRALLARVLRSRGYSVVEAGDGAEAMALAEAAPSPFALLLTDVIMPEITGPELAKHLRARGQIQHVIFMTGYADTPVESGAPELLLRKPFSPSTLADAVRQTLKGQ